MLNWLDRILQRVLPYRDITKVIDGKEELYLRRYFLRRHDREEEAGTHGDKGGIFLHHIFRSDDDRDPHDHPWSFKTLILKGFYMDEQWKWGVIGDAGFRWKMGMFPAKWLTWHEREAQHLHRVRLPEGKDAWTLVFTGPKERSWGFMTEDGWVHWRDYLQHADSAQK